MSVIITTYNRISFLERALKSLEGQTFKNFEVIISDDYSSVNVEGFLDNYKINSSLNIIYRCNERNSGACYTRNEGIKIAQGQYVTGLDDDDEFTPSRLDLFIKEYNCRYSFVISNTEVTIKKHSKNLFKSEREISLNDVLWANNVGTQVFGERERILRLGGFDNNLTSAQDADMWVRLIGKFGIALRLKDATYILHTEHDMPRISTSDKKINGMKGIFEKHRSLMDNKQIKFRELQISFYEGRKLSSFLKMILDVRIVKFLVLKKIGYI